MTIAAHIVSSSVTGFQQNFRFYLLSFLAAKYPEHHFIFIFDRPFDPEIIAEKNITPVLMQPAVKNNLLRHYWYNFKIPSILSRYQADVFFTNGICCSLRTKVPQCMVIADTTFLEPRNAYPAADLRYIKKYFKKFIDKSAFIIVHNDYTAATLIKTIPQIQQKIHVINSGGNIVPSVLSSEEQEEIKTKYTNGAEYFLGFISAETSAATIPLLKAFSAFKKRQRSGMQLLLLVTLDEMEKLKAVLSNYKFREEVRLVEDTNERLKSNLAATAYAALDIPTTNAMESNGLYAYINQVPLITADNGFQRSMYGDAAMYTEPDEKDISEKMMLIYKDENLRKEKVLSAKRGAALFSIEQAADKLWHVLAGTAGQKS